MALLDKLMSGMAGSDERIGMLFQDDEDAPARKSRRIR
jgi:hypothetical protein